MNSPEIGHPVIETTEPEPDEVIDQPEPEESQEGP